MTDVSRVGALLSGACGIQELMDDLGAAQSVSPALRMLGGGQPAAIPEIQTVWRARVRAMVEDGTVLDRALLNYDPPLGNPTFREAMAGFLRRECGWEVNTDNVAVLPSSQTAFFLLFNLLAGESPGGRKRILFPLVPEYIGYANQGLEPELFTASIPIIETRGAHEFKYHVDFDRLKLGPDIAAVCLSCPTNPSGNVVAGPEFDRLRTLAAERRIPLIVDNAYGHPFPDVVHTGFAPRWEPGMVFSISLSKIGLPGVRTAIMVADPPIVRALGNMNAIVSLANGNLGQAILLPLLADDTLRRLSREVIRPFYRARSDAAAGVFAAAAGERFPWALHAREGAFFLWLWLKDLPIPAAEVYRRLKERNVLVIPGNYFFFGLDRPWKHSQECLRLTFSQPEAIVREGLEILADEVARIAAMH